MQGSLAQRRSLRAAGPSRSGEAYEYSALVWQQGAGLWRGGGNFYPKKTDPSKKI
jgi:hypothetical protein